MMNTISRYGLAALLFTLCVLVTYQVVARYVPFIPPFLWTEEIARLVFIWMIMVGSAIAFTNRTHFAFGFLSEAVPTKARRWIEVLVLLITLGVMGIFAWSGWEVTLRGLERASLVTGMPQATSYSALLVGGLGGVPATVVLLVRAVQGQPLPKGDAFDLPTDVVARTGPGAILEGTDMGADTNSDDL